MAFQFLSLSHPSTNFFDTFLVEVAICASVNGLWFEFVRGAAALESVLQICCIFNDFPFTNQMVMHKQ
jgi:hypothetical protein